MSEQGQRLTRAASATPDAVAYDRGRPGYPDDAVAWLVGDAPRTVLELGAGTGQLTRRLVAAGHDVHATEPDCGMLDVLQRHLPDVLCSMTSAEELPVDDASVDVVVAAQSWHWFDPERTLAEVARVLRPGGHLALVWNHRDERIPWVRKLGRALGSPTGVQAGGPLPDDAAARLARDVAGSELFEATETATFKHWQAVDRRSIVDLAGSLADVATLGDAARQRVLADVLALYDDYGRGMDGMQLPYLTLGVRAAVVPQAEPEPTAPDDAEPLLEPTVPLAFADRPDGPDPLDRRDPFDPLVDSADRIPRVALEDSGLLLIDLR